MREVDLCRTVHHENVISLEWVRKFSHASILSRPSRPTKKNVNVISFVQIFQAHEDLYLVFEYCNSDLDKYMKTRGGALPDEAFVRDLMQQLGLYIVYR